MDNSKKNEKTRWSGPKTVGVIVGGSIAGFLLFAVLPGKRK